VHPELVNNENRQSTIFDSEEVFSNGQRCSDNTHDVTGFSNIRLQIELISLFAEIRIKFMVIKRIHQWAELKLNVIWVGRLSLTQRSDAVSNGETHKKNCFFHQVILDRYCGIIIEFSWPSSVEQKVPRLNKVKGKSTWLKKVEYFY